MGGSVKGTAPSGNTVQTINSVPFNAGFLRDVANKAENAPGIGAGPSLQYFPGQTVAPFTPAQNQALQSEINLGLNDPTMQAASQGITPYLNGSMLSAGNPFFSNMVNQLGQSLAPAIDSHFNMNGRSGSPANQQTFADALTREAGQLGYQNYTDQSMNQLRAILESPAVSSGNFASLGQALGAGNQQQAQQQSLINEAVNRFNFGQDVPFLQLSRLASLVGPATPGSQTTTAPYYSNSLGAGLGALSTIFGGSGSNGTGPSLFTNIFGQNGLFGGNGALSGIGSGLYSMFGNGFGGSGSFYG